MGFDTDDGTNPGHGAGGFPLFLDATSVWNGTAEADYDWWNDWASTTDMFHRMTVTFDASSLVTAGAPMVFLQDTDEVPLPPPAALMVFGVAGLLQARRRNRLAIK